MLVSSELKVRYNDILIITGSEIWQKKILVQISNKEMLCDLQCPHYWILI